MRTVTLGDAETVGVTSGPLVEVSGLVADRGGLWCHNDSGDRARTFWCSAHPIAEWAWSGAVAYDWEDIGIGRGPQPADTRPWLWVADTGSARPAAAPMALIGAPLPTDPAAGGRIKDWQRFEFRAAGLIDCEAVLWSWTSGAYAFDKRTSPDGRAAVWHLPIVAGHIVPRRIASIPLRLATAADMTADGRIVAVRSYTTVLVWQRRPAESTATLLGRDPDGRAVDNAGAEAIALDPTGNAYTSVTEGRVARFRRRTITWENAA